MEEERVHTSVLYFPLSQCENTHDRRGAGAQWWDSSLFRVLPGTQLREPQRCSRGVPSCSPPFCPSLLGHERTAPGQTPPVSVTSLPCQFTFPLMHRGKMGLERTVSIQSLLNRDALPSDGEGRWQNGAGGAQGLDVTVC